MVGFLGFAVLAIGGGALALLLGVPPIFIGAYIVGLLLLGAITGFSSDSSGGGGGGGSSGGNRSGGGSGSTLNKVAEAANGFMEGLELNNDDPDPTSSGPRVVSLNASDASSGASASDIDIRVGVRSGSSGLAELKIEVPGLGSNTADIGGSSHSDTYNLASDILEDDPSPPDDTYRVRATVQDGEGETSSRSAGFKIGGSSGGGGSSTSDGSGGGGPDFSEMFKNMTIGQSQQQQVQQQMMSWMQMYQAQMQQQQMQRMMNPAVMQFGNLLQGNFNVVNNTVIVPGENSEVEINIQQMQQLVQVLSQSQQNENYLLSIMAMLIQEGDGGLNQQIINQITNLVYEENKGDISIEQEINRFINKKRVEYINEILIQEVEQNFNLSQVHQGLALQISEFFIALENTQFDVEGNEVIIQIQDASNLEIHYSTLLQFLKVVNKVPEGLVETIVVQILNQVIIDGGSSNVDEEMIREIIMIIEKAKEGDLESSPTDIQVENIVIINENRGEKLPEKMLDNGGLVYKAPAGISSGSLKVNPRTSTSGGDLQEVIFSLSSGNGSTQKRIGVDSSSFGYNGEGVTLGDIKGQFKLKPGQQYNLGVTFIAKDGNQRNKVCRIQVKRQNGGSSQVPAKQGNTEIAKKRNKSGVPANPQNAGNSNSGSEEGALVPQDENEIQKDLREAGEDISEAENLAQKALEDAEAGRLPEAEEEAEEAEEDLQEANEDIEESEEDISHIESVEGDHLGETEELISNTVSNEENLAANLDSIANEIKSVKKNSSTAYNDLISGDNSEKVDNLENRSLIEKGNSALGDTQKWKNSLNSNWGKVTTIKDRLNAEIRSLNHLSTFLQTIDQDIHEEENAEEILKQLADYASDQGLEENTERIIKQTLQLKEQEKQEKEMYREIRKHLQNSFRKVEKLEKASKQIEENIQGVAGTVDNERKNRAKAARQRSGSGIDSLIDENEENLSEINQVINSAENVQKQKIYSIENIKSDLQSFDN